MFLDAVPPSRIGTNFVEHVIPLPSEVPVVDPSTLDCVPDGDRDRRYGALLASGRSAVDGAMSDRGVVKLPTLDARRSRPRRGPRLL
ncbi:MAG: hypothetical protein P8R42_24925 [Candidatus Binatia bacterium]|nr:hypothetical protein [Candidatus Binatia bacterium]